MRPQASLLLQPTLFTLLLAGVLGASARADITSGLVGYYKLDERANLSAADSSGLAPAATLNNFYSDPTQWVEGWTNNALQFDGTQLQYALIDDSTNGLNFATRANPSFTLALWVQGAAGVTQPAGAGLIARGYGHGGEQYLMDLYSGYYRLGIRDAYGASYTIQQSLAALRCDGSWQHVVGVFDSTAGANQLKIYVNGQLAYQQTATNSLYNITHDVSLGAREDTSTSGYTVAFSGKLDDVRFFARALAASDVLELYNAAGKAPVVTTPPQDASLYVGDTANFSVSAQGTLPFSYQWRMYGTNLPSATNATYSIANVQLANAGSYDVIITNIVGSTTSSAAVLTVANPPADITSGLVAYFKLDDATGIVAADATGRTAGAGLVNYTTDAQWLPTGGRTNGAYNFPGLTDSANPLSGQYMDVNDGGALDFSAMTTPALTVALWVKTPPGFLEPGGAGLVARGYGRAGEQYVLDLWDNGPRFFVRDAAGTTYMARADSGGPFGTNALHINTGAWVHLVGVLDPTVSPALIKLFVNGQFVISASAAPSFLASTSDTTLGCRQDSSTSGYNLPFTGRMDDVRIYNRALTPADVQALYASVGSAAPSFAVPLVNTTNFVLSATTLSVMADGTIPLSYQWQWYGTNLAGQTASTFNIAVSQLSHSGPYSVVVTNLYGSATSSAYLAIVQLDPADYSTALAAQWKFDERSGTNAIDAIDNGHPLNLVNFPADNSQWVSPGRTGDRALRFNSVADDVNGGTNDYCVTASGFAMPYNYDLFTFAFWLKLDSTTYGANPRVITPTIRPWALWSASGGVRIYNAAGGTAPQLNKWTHYALVYDRANKVYSCYVNGVKVVNNAGVETKTAPTPSTLWVVGHNENTANGADYFRGQLNDLRVYNRLLNDTQVAALYASYPDFLQILADPQSASVPERSPVTFTVTADGSPAPTYQWQKNGIDIPGATSSAYTLQYASLSDNNAHFRAVVSNSFPPKTSGEAILTVTTLPAADYLSNLTLYYTFDETNDITAHDSSGNGNDGTLNNWDAAAGKWEPGKLGNALHFNGGPFTGGTTVSNNNYVMIPPLNGLADGNNFTFAFWAKLDPSRPTFNNPRIFATYNTASWVMWERSSSPTGIGFWHGAAGTPAPEANLWHHYVVSFDRLASRYDVYVDGVRKVWKGVPTNPATEADPTSSGGYAWVLGHRENISPSNDTESFIGWLDDLRLYNRQFTINDAEALYQAANVPPGLSMRLGGNNVVFSWPSWASGYTLQSASSLGGATWAAAPGTPVLVEATFYQTNSLGTGTKFFRLVK